MRDTAEAAVGQRISLSVFRLEGWSVKLQNRAVFSETVLPLTSSPSCFLLAWDVKNFRMCHRPGERACFLLGIELERDKGSQHHLLCSREGHAPHSPKDHLGLPVSSCWR